MSDVFDSSDAGPAVDKTGNESQQVPQFDDDVLTKADFEKLLEGNKVPEGQYVMKVSGIKRIMPEDKKPGGDQVTFQVVMPPPGAQAPEGGWRPVTRLFKKFLAPDEKGKTSERIDKEQKAQFIKACGVEIGPTVNMYEALQACVGSQIFVTASNRESGGQTYQDLKGFKPFSV